MEENHFVINYNNTLIEVNPNSFSKNSPVFSHIYSPNQNQVLVLNGSYSVDTYREFIKAAENKTPTITFDNWNDLKCLAEEWEMKILSQQLSEFYERMSDPETLIKLILETPKKSRIISQLQSLICQVGVRIVTYPQFVELPFKLIRQIFQNSNWNYEDQNVLFDFIFDLLKNEKEHFFQLFDFIRLSEVSDDRLFKLLTLPNLNTKIFTRSLSNLCIGLIDRLESLSCQRVSLPSNKRDNISKMKRDLTNISQKNQILKQQIETVDVEIAHVKKNIQNQKKHEKQINYQQKQQAFIQNIPDSSHINKKNDRNQFLYRPSD